MNGNGASASFINPRSLAVDSTGNIYVADLGNHSIRKISPTGEVTTLAGNGQQVIKDGDGLQASFYMRANLGLLTIDAQNNLYIGDMEWNTGYLRKVSTLDGTVTTVCGSSADASVIGKTCKTSGLWINMGLTITPEGTVYFGFGNKIYKISHKK